MSDQPHAGWPPGEDDEQPVHDDNAGAPVPEAGIPADQPPADEVDRALALEEPPPAPDDTKPKAPIRLPDDAQDSLSPDAVFHALAAEEPPITALVDTAEIRAAPAPARALLLAAVMLGTVCLCLALVSLAGFAGYRDGLATNDVRITQTLATGIAEQYATGVADLEQGYAELAAARFAWIVETVRPPAQYASDSAQLLSTARAISSYTPTVQPTATPTLEPSLAPTLSPTPEPTQSSTATLDPMQDPAYFYNQAATAMSVFRYEEAIEWLDALQALAPDYRAAEAKAMLMDALTKQGHIYLYGQNEDGEDRLARGVLLIYRANELGPVEPSTLLGQAIFVERYLNARNYVAGGYYAAALPILEQLCAENCGWGYPNWEPVTVSDLLEQARSGAAP